MILNKYFKNILEIYKLYWIEKICFYEIDRNNKIYVNINIIYKLLRWFSNQIDFCK